MTTNLRDLMAQETDHLGLLEDLTAETITTGRTKLRRRTAGRATIAGATVVAAILAGTTWLSPGSGELSIDESSGFVADQPQVSDPPPTNSFAVRDEWAQRLGQVFAAHVPDGFTSVVSERGSDGEPTGVLQFLATGPQGQVQLNATVYRGRALPTPTCATSKASQCRVLTTTAGTATVLKDVHSGDDLQSASQIWVTGGGTQTIVNVVEENPGVSQYTMPDLTSIATEESLDKAIDFAVAHATDLQDYAVY